MCTEKYSPCHNLHEHDLLLNPIVTRGSGVNVGWRRGHLKTGVTSEERKKEEIWLHLK